MTQPRKPGGRILAASNPFLAQIEQAKPETAKEKATYEGSPYEAPKISAYTVTKGKNAGSIKYSLQFTHKANPVWSRRFDLTDLGLILDNLEMVQQAHEALKTKAS